MHKMLGVLIAAGVVFVMSVVTLIVMRTGEPGAAGSGAGASIRPINPNFPEMYLPEFSLVDQNGSPQTHELLAGRVTIVDFIFTNCPLACPGMTLEMSRLQRALTGAPVRLLSFSVDPAHDTPEVLNRYGEGWEADPKRWVFLTGTIGAVRAILTDSLKFAIADNPEQMIELGDGSKMANIVHPTKLLLVGPDRRIHGMYEYQSAEQMERLQADARELVKRVGKVRP